MLFLSERLIFDHFVLYLPSGLFVFYGVPLMRPPPVEAVSGRKNTWEENEKEDSGFSSGAVPRGGARSGDCICRGVYKYLGWQHSLSVFAGGTGTAENPYQIATGAQLAYLASSVNNGETYAGKNFVLTADIDLNKAPLDADCKRLFRCAVWRLKLSYLRWQS